MPLLDNMCPDRCITYTMVQETHCTADFRFPKDPKYRTICRVSIIGITN